MTDKWTRTWVLELAIGAPLTMNERLHWQEKARRAKHIVDTTIMTVRVAGIPPLGRCEVTMTYLAIDKRHRDADNLVATLKPICDGLVRAGVVADDTPDLMVKHMPTIKYAPAGKFPVPKVRIVVNQLEAL